MMFEVMDERDGKRLFFGCVPMSVPAHVNVRIGVRRSNHVIPWGPKCIALKSNASFLPSPIASPSHEQERARARGRRAERHPPPRRHLCVVCFFSPLCALQITQPDGASPPPPTHTLSPPRTHADFLTYIPYPHTHTRTAQRAGRRRRPSPPPTATRSCTASSP